MADADIADRVWAHDAALLRDTVREAGALALSLFRTELKNWTKGASSPVSEADIAVNDLVERRLRAATPDYGWLSEESVDDDSRLGKELAWIVDPIDGTRAYLAHREDWCVRVALVAGSAPVLAAVFAPATDEFFFAIRDRGATRNERPVRPPESRALGSYIDGHGTARRAGGVDRAGTASKVGDGDAKTRVRRPRGGDHGSGVGSRRPGHGSRDLR